MTSRIFLVLLGISFVFPQNYILTNDHFCVASGNSQNSVYSLWDLVNHYEGGQSANGSYVLKTGPVNYLALSNVGVLVETIIPDRFFIDDNVPNPFNNVTAIRFGLNKAGKTRIIVHNIKGEHIRTLVDRTLPAGTHTVAWDGRNNTGNEIASGIYYYKIESGGFKAVKNMMLLK